MLTGILPLLKCSSGYEEKDGKKTFNGKVITDKSFIILNEVFAKDSAYVYYKEKSITHADVASFEALDEHYARDKNLVYYCDEYREGQNYYLTKKQTIYTLENIHPGSFKILGAGYARDSIQAFFEGISFRVKDLSTLKTVNRYFVKDSFYAYFNFHPVAESDGKTFEIVDRNYAKDKAHVYFYEISEEGKPGIFRVSDNPSTFEILAYPYSKDKTTVFYGNVKIPGAHPPGFKVLNSGYAADQQAVFFGSKKMTGVDIASFMPYKENELYTQDNYHAHDKSFVFWKEKKLTGAAVGNFKVLGQGYGSDSQHVFYKDRIVKTADPHTFKVYPHGFGNADSEDAVSKFNAGSVVKDE